MKKFTLSGTGDAAAENARRNLGEGSAGFASSVPLTRVAADARRVLLLFALSIKEPQLNLPS